MGCVVNRRRGGDGTPPLCDAVNKYRARHTRQRKDPRQPRRGRRPRRPANKIKTPPPAAFSPFPTLRPAPGKSRGTRPVPQGPVGDGVLDDPFLRPPPAPPRSSDPLVGAGFHPRPGVGFGWEELAVLSCVSLRWCCLIHPISLVLPKETGWSPKEKRLWGGGAPVRFRDPPASPTRVGAATRPLRCPLRGRIGSLAPGARGLGWK